MAGFASLIGVVAVGMGLYGLYKLGFIEGAMTMGRAFDNPEFGNINVQELPAVSVPGSGWQRARPSSWLR
jgi:hypothetical protein